MVPFFKNFYLDLKANYQQVFLYVMLFFMFMILIPRAGHDGDVGYWKAWAAYIFNHGLGNIYAVDWNNYNPLYHYILFLFGKLAGSEEKINLYIHYLKGFTLLFDFAGAIIAASFVTEDRNRRFLLALFLLFNIGYLYNTLVWEQVDAIFTAFAFIALVLGLKRYPVWSFMFFLLALNAKTQAIIFLPPLLMVWFPYWLRSFKTVGKTIVAGFALQVLLLTPFIWFGDANYLPRIIDVVVNAVDFFPYVSMNAFNGWYLVFWKENLMEMPDTLMFAGRTYKQWGLLLFMAFSLITLLPLFVLSVRKILAKENFLPQEFPVVLLSCGLIPILFTYFNTQMHERYWHGAILFLAAYGFLTRNYLIYIICSVAYFLNMEGVLFFLQLKNYKTLIFDPQFIAGLFAIVLLVGIWQLYRLSNFTGNLKVIWNLFWPERNQQLTKTTTDSTALKV